MKDNKQNKKIDAARDEKNHLLTVFLITISGSLTVLIQNGLNIKGWFAVAGLFTGLLFFFFYIQKSIRIDNLIEDLEE